MSAPTTSILLIGESGVGKTHYGAQLLRRLMTVEGSLRMDGAATNLEPFEAALESLNEGRAADHTARSVYVDSVWPVTDAAGNKATLVWPEYGGEQIKSIIETRRLPQTWQDRVNGADTWLLLIRLQQTRMGDDIFSKPLSDLRGSSHENHEVHPSDQARLVELLQILLFAHRSATEPRLGPRLGVILTCWDEEGTDGLPNATFETRMPLVSAFVRTNWSAPIIMGLSALERSLSPKERDTEYAARGPEHFGYVIKPDGERTSDLTIPIHALLPGRAVTRQPT
ncbi:hypothetical protein [Tardiphaga sp. 803_E3_N1_3]|uniref:TRAFAC clade GTPase domain-containing protein n=1 Tax=Tardiphaga sp. 803_E3_N1_3 TaxID=3240785 RepID=UPI003F27B7EC